MDGADMAIWVDVVDEDIIIPKRFLALYIGSTLIRHTPHYITDKAPRLCHSLGLNLRTGKIRFAKYDW